MALPPSFLDDVRARTSLVAVIGQRVKLVRAGREWKACCPFHNERTPSFFVNEEKNFYHCFSCGAHGDAIGFLMEHDGLSFIDAIRQLAEAAGLEVPKREDGPAARKRTTAHALLGEAASWYAQRLHAAEGRSAHNYLKQRQISDEITREFGLGYAPAGHEPLIAALQAATPAPDMKELEAVGLIGERDGRRYARFRDRLIFPIHDPRGRVVGFGGRALGDIQPKYLNSADSPFFSKGRLLYNYHRAAPTARKSGTLLVVEGYMDVVGLRRAGFVPAVAPLGTALTEEQILLAWRLVDCPVAAFDGDDAGTRAGHRAAQRALPLLRPGKSLAFVALPAGQDPDDIARDGGAQAIEALLDGAQPLDRFLFDQERRAFEPLDTPERRAALLERLEALTQEIPDGTIASGYRRVWRNRFFEEVVGTGRQSSRRGRANRRPSAPRPLQPETRAAATLAGEAVILARILHAIAGRPGAAVRHQELLLAIDMPTAELERLREAIVSGRHHMDDGTISSGNTLLHTLSEREFDERIHHALASLAELHHIEKESAPRDCEDDEAFAREYARRAKLGAARAMAKKRLADWAIDNAGRSGDDR